MYLLGNNNLVFLHLYKLYHLRNKYFYIIQSDTGEIIIDLSYPTEINPKTGELIVDTNTMITSKVADEMIAAGIEKVKVEIV